jgi:membrane associated rhomboid family serine protease
MVTDLRTPAQRRGAVSPALVIGWIVVVIWLAESLDYLLPVQMDYWGIEARTLNGLTGVPLAPFLHADFRHVIANTVPLVLLGLLVAWRAGAALPRVLVFVVLLGGLGVWLLAPSDVITIGASGLVFGLLGYLLAAGVVTRRWVDVLLSVIVLVVFGGMLSGITPIGVGYGVSWLAHMAGFGAGVAAALLFAPRRARVAHA